MKIIFLINRINDYITFGRLIEEAIKRKNKVVCFHNYTPLKERSFRFSYIHLNPLKNQVKTKKILFEKNLYQKLINERCDFVFTKLLPPLTHNEKFIEKIKGKILIVQDSLDTPLVLTNLYLYNNYKINIFVWSFFFKKRILKCLKEIHHLSYLSIKNKNSKIFISGHSFYNSKLDKLSIKKKYKVPIKKKIILYTPFAYDDNTTSLTNKYWKVFFSGLNVDFFPRITNKKVNIICNVIKKIFLIIRSFIFSPNKIISFFKIKSEYKILKEIHKFCIENNYYLIIKSRKKYFTNTAWYEFGNKVIVDEETKFHPSLLQEIIYITDLHICYTSNVAFEVALRNIPTINIKTHKNEWFFAPGLNIFEYMGFNNKFFNFNHVVESYSLKEFKIKIKNIKQQYYKKYVKTFLGNNSCEKNIYKILKKL